MILTFVSKASVADSATTEYFYEFYFFLWEVFKVVHSFIGDLIVDLQGPAVRITFNSDFKTIYKNILDTNIVKDHNGDHYIVHSTSA